MNVLVGVEMSRSMSHQAIERAELAGDFILHRTLILQWDYGIEGDPFSGAKDLFAQVDMQPDTKIWKFPGTSRRISSSRPAYHETGAGHDSAAMCPHNAVVNSLALAEIIRVHDEIPGYIQCSITPRYQLGAITTFRPRRFYTPASIIICRSSASASKYSAAISLAACECLG